MLPQDPEKQKDVGELFGGAVDSDEFARLVTIGKLITDYKAPNEPQEGDVVAGDALDEETGVAVEFEGEDDDEEEEDGTNVVDVRLRPSSAVPLLPDGHGSRVLSHLSSWAAC